MKFSMSMASSCDLSTTRTRSDIVATSSICSFMYQRMNCSLVKSLSPRAVAASALICSLTRFSWSSARRRARRCRQTLFAAMRFPGRQRLHLHRVDTGSCPSRAFAPPALGGRKSWQVGQSLCIKVHRDRNILLVGGELSCDLLIQLFNKRFGGHRLILSVWRPTNRTAECAKYR